MIVLGLETSCDETGVALYHSERGLLAQALHSQVDLHRTYGGVVPELASRDHVRRLLPLIESTMTDAGISRDRLDAVAFTAGPGLAGALMVGAATGAAIAWALELPALPVHHLEAHLLSPLLADPAPDFPFVALLVSGGHTQLLVAESVGRYRLLGDTLDDAAGEAFDKSAKMLGLPYPGGPALSALARQGRPGRFRLPRPMLRSGDLDFSFSGLKTAVLTQIRREPDDEQTRADLAAEIECAITDVLAAKSLAALRETGLGRLVVAGGVSANSRLRERLAEGCSAAGHELYLPPPALCTDNGVMIALAASLRLQAGLEAPKSYRFDVRPRWPLSELAAESERVG